MNFVEFLVGGSRIEGDWVDLYLSFVAYSFWVLVTYCFEADGFLCKACQEGSGDWDANHGSGISSGFFFFFGCQICLLLASIWIYMVDRSYNCDYKKVFVPPITILHFLMFWWLQYIDIYKCVFFSLIYCVLGGAMKLCRRKWMLFFMVKVRFFLFSQIQELVRGAKNAVSLAQVCFFHFSTFMLLCCIVFVWRNG